MKANAQQKAIEKIKASRKHKSDIIKLIQALLNGEITTLSQAITCIEGTTKTQQEMAKAVIAQCISQTKPSIRIGITGVPGVGKSTFIEKLGLLLANKNRKIAVLAIDPSSSISKGSILGDKTRMEQLVQHPNVFIRPTPSSNSLGGVARKTRETIILCEAAGFDTIFVETVGVGQSEIAAHSMTDFFLLLKLAGAGDTLQGIKRGIMEMADGIAINKADGHNKVNAQKAAAQFNKALHLFPPKVNGWTPQALTCSALTGDGLEGVWQYMETYLTNSKSKGYFKEKRTAQNLYWFQQTLEREFIEQGLQEKGVPQKIEILKAHIQAGKISPFEAAEIILNKQPIPHV